MSFDEWAKARFKVLQGRIDVGVYDCDDMQECWNAALTEAQRICREDLYKAAAEQLATAIGKAKV